MPRSAPPAPALAAAIQRLRHQQGFSQERLALDANLAVAAVSRVERAVTNPSWSTIRAIINTLGITLHQLANAIETKSTRVCQPHPARRTRRV